MRESFVSTIDIGGHTYPLFTGSRFNNILPKTLRKVREGYFLKPYILWLAYHVLSENFNRNYRLQFKRLYRRGILRNHDYRKKEVEKWVTGCTYKVWR